MFKKTATSLLAILLLWQNAFWTYADTDNINLPNIGTIASSTLSIGQENEMGDYYMRLLRNNAPILNDPLLNDYINQLGQKLVKQADSVQTPFHFYIMKSNVLNAFAFFGGNVIIHSKLILDTDNESQLASVMAHEIGHVTQRHLARAMENQSRNSPYIWGATLGSILLALAAPEAGMAAITGTIAGSSQSVISFTQNNEQEADRVGLRTLAKAGFNPHASSDFLNKLADQSRYMTKPPEILLTHPLPESRLTDIRNRSLQYAQKDITPSLAYYLAKARLVIMINNNRRAGDLLISDYKKLNNSQSQTAAIYAAVLQNYQTQNYYQAKQQLQKLLDNDANNIWYIDLMTDIDLALNNNKEAINRLQLAVKKNPDNPTLQLNLANAYIQNKQYQQAVSLLHSYTYTHNQDMNGWELLVTAYGGLNSRSKEMAAHAENLALEGQFAQAIQLLNNAKFQTKGDQLQLSRIEARIKQLQQLEKRYAAYKR